MRYFAAVGVAIMICGTIFIVGWWLHRSVLEYIELESQQRASTATLPEQFENLAPNIVKMRGVDTELPDQIKVRLVVADLIYALWFMWVPVILVTCLGVTVIVSRLTRSRIGDAGSQRIGSS